MTTFTGKPFLYTIHGIEHCPVSGSIDPLKFRESLSYQPDPSDVFVVTFPKCGTTWTENIIDLLMNDLKPGPAGLTGAMLHFLEYFAGKETIEQLPKPRWVKTHLPFDLAPYNSQTKYIYVTRNPFDCCVSYYFHTFGIKAYQFNGTFDQYFELFINGQVDYGDYFRHVVSWYAHKNDDNVLFLTYEEMKEDPAEAITKIGNFIGGKSAEIVQDETKLSEVVKMTSFDAMKVTHDMSEEEKVIVKEGYTFMRKGKVSDFRNYFKKDQYDRLKEKYDSALKATTLHQYWSKFIEFE